MFDSFRSRAALAFGLFYAAKAAGRNCVVMRGGMRADAPPGA